MSNLSNKINILGGKLRELHRSFPAGEKTTAIHLFGIKYSDEMLDLTRADLDKVSEAAGLKPIYGLELRKMIKLGKYVMPK
ncbi:hypothetical protein GON01_05715 [Sphingomonas sp. MAH-20]|uniref:HTH-like domain-containing protein n=1 Tax=Sphingomonas horti TaxID=2682842 RepID=A0A6I4IZE0_9SPHN|nr:MULTISPECIES: hypothetical protein [Sphingomonas]MBA2918469.1 hypothetical protein [Sphingomonas sp. CGMCC 1.13658]MVO77436.1 hypothetical protein [Sphingomonas horti]